ncbi:MAG: hypothetical protein M0Z47_04870 [Actinomycetota bacterium]|nr:hypothetical protein [Actinomycetota bacterium]
MAAAALSGIERGGAGRPSWPLEPVVLAEQDQFLARFLPAYLRAAGSFADDIASWSHLPALVAVVASGRFGPGRAELAALGELVGSERRSRGAGLVCFAVMRPPFGWLKPWAERRLFSTGARSGVEVVPVYVRPDYPEHSAALVLARLEAELRDRRRA